MNANNANANMLLYNFVFHFICTILYSLLLLLLSCHVYGFQLSLTTVPVTAMKEKLVIKNNNSIQ
jgi:hypothetical protein